MNRKIVESDLESILTRTGALWYELKDKKIFITGGTGFFGSWFLETIVFVNNKLNLNIGVVVLTRNYNGFRIKLPHLANTSFIRFIAGDIRNFKFPNEEFDYIIHSAATNAQETFDGIDPLNKFETTANGTKHILDFAVFCKAKKFLLTSSGAIYGKQPESMGYITEDYLGAPDQLDVISSALSEAKRVSEFYAIYYADKYDFEVKIARCFTFVGPYLQMNIHYAIGNFIKSAIEERKIYINGNGTPQRSFLYTSDLMVWLWTILLKGASGEVYNVGSANSVTILELAKLVASNFDGSIDIQIAKNDEKKTSSSNRYVPSVKKVEEDLGLEEMVNLKEAIRRTIRSLDC